MITLEEISLIVSGEIETGPAYKQFDGRILGAETRLTVFVRRRGLPFIDSGPDSTTTSTTCLMLVIVNSGMSNLDCGKQIQNDI